MAETLNQGKADQTGVTYERRLLTSKKLMPGVNAGNLFLSEPYEVPIKLAESIANSRAGVALTGLVRELHEAHKS